MNGVARPVCVAGTQCFSDRQQRALQLLPRLISRLSLTPACHSPRKLAGHLPPPVILVVLAFCMQVCDLGAKERGKARRHLLRCEEVNQLDEATQAIVLRLHTRRRSRSAGDVSMSFGEGNGRTTLV